MTSSLVTVQFDKDGPLELVEVDLPAPTEHEVLVAIDASGVCQSQLMWMHLDRESPMLFGHEGLGRIEAVGSSVEGLAVGDGVLVTWLPRTDRPVERAGVVLPDGTRAMAPNVYTWATRVVVDELYVRRLPDGFDDPRLSILGCAVITGAGAVVNVVDVDAGSTVAVIGTGGVGLSAVAAARRAGAASVVAVDLSDEKLQLARVLGATDVVNGSTDDVSATLKKIQPDGYDVVYDCVATQSTFDQGLEVLKGAPIGHGLRGGSLVLVGVPKAPLQMNGADLMVSGRTVTGTLAGSCTQDQLGEFLGWAVEGSLDLGEMVTDIYPYSEIGRAADDLAAGRIAGRAIFTTGGQ